MFFGFAFLFHVIKKLKAKRAGHRRARMTSIGIAGMIAGRAREVEPPAPRSPACSGMPFLGSFESALYPQSKKTPVKRHRGEPEHTRDTRAHTGTRITQTNLTTIQTLQHTRSPARPRDDVWYRYCTGTGSKTPVGPVSLDFATNLHSRSRV